MTTLLPALRNGSILRPFLDDVFRDLDELRWSTSVTRLPEPTGFSMDVVEYQDRYELTADLPGFSNEEVEITLNNGRLAIEVKPRAEVQNSTEEPQARYLLRERRIGAMSRTITLPRMTSEDNIQASMKDGVLTVTIKKDEAAVPKRIKVH